jgi:hypothetical protein
MISSLLLRRTFILAPLNVEIQGAKRALPRKAMVTLTGNPLSWKWMPKRRRSPDLGSFRRPAVDGDFPLVDAAYGICQEGCRRQLLSLKQRSREFRLPNDAQQGAAWRVIVKAELERLSWSSPSAFA